MEVHHYLYCWCRFGLFGTVLVYANAASVMPQAEMAIFWSEVLKQSSLLDPTLMLLAFVFVLIGFGTKTGLFPMHAAARCSQ